MCTLVLLIFFTFLNILCPGYFVRSSSFSLFSVFVFLVYSQHLYFCFFTVMEIFLADESTYVVVMITFFCYGNNDGNDDSKNNKNDNDADYNNTSNNNSDNDILMMMIITML